MTLSNFSIRDFYNTKEPPAPSLWLAFSNPLFGAVLWDTWALDLETRQMVTADPSGIQELFVLKQLNLASKTFLLWVQEVPGYGAPGPYNLGPYLVTIPSLGVYTWDSTNGRIDGIQAVNLPLTDNESDVVGTVMSWDWKGENKPWGLTSTVVSSTPVVGKEDVGSLYVGQTIAIEVADHPMDSLGQPLIPVGAQTTCKLKMEWGQYASQWHAWDFHAPREYPDSAYQFSATLVDAGTVDREFYDSEAGWYTRPCRQYDWSITGNVTNFLAVVCMKHMYGVSIAWSGIGPASGSYWITEDDLAFGYSSPGPIYAHPNPDAPAWNQYTWDYNNWQSVL